MMALLPLISLVLQALLISAKHIAIDESIAKSMCDQMTKFQETKELQEEVKDKHPEVHGCAWIHWKTCNDADRKCPSTFERQQLDKCPGSAGADGGQSGGATGGAEPGGGEPGRGAPGGDEPGGDEPGGGAPGGDEPGGGEPPGGPPGVGAPPASPPGGGDPPSGPPGGGASPSGPPAGGAPPTAPPGGVAPGPGGGNTGVDLPEDAMKVSMDVDGNQRCYILDSSAKLKLEDARAICKKRGGSLLSIKSVAENAIMEAILGAHAGHADDEYWTDLEMKSKPYKWKTADMEMTYTDPSFKGSEGQCLAVSVPFGAKTIKWSSVGCDGQFYAMCELDGGCDIKAPTEPETPQPSSPTTVTMTAEIDEEPLCYIVDIVTQKTKREAETDCIEKLGGNLVAIESMIEQFLIEASMNSNGLSSGGYWTSANLTENKWQSTGQPIEYKPENFKDNGKECMTLNPNGNIVEWTGVDCGGKQFSFCEKHGPCSGSGPPPPPPTGGPPTPPPDSTAIPPSGPPPTAPSGPPSMPPSGPPSIPPSGTPPIPSSGPPLTTPSGPPPTGVPTTVDPSNPPPITTPVPTGTAPVPPGMIDDSSACDSASEENRANLPQPPPQSGPSPTYTQPVVGGPSDITNVNPSTTQPSVVNPPATGAPTMSQTSPAPQAPETATLGVVTQPATAKPPVALPPPAGAGNQGPDDGTWLTMSIGVDGINVCYALQTSQKTTAEEATSSCQKTGRGDLVSIETKYENIILESFMYSSEVGSDGFWTSADLSTRKWKSTGLEFEYKDSSIDGEQSGQCMTVKLTAGVIGWVSTSCTETHYALCEKHGDCSAPDQAAPPKASTIPVGVARLNAEYNGKQSCYTVSHSTTATMQEAEAICTKEGYGKLVSIETQEEHEILNALLRSVRLTVAPSDLGYWTSADLSVDSAFKWKSIDKPFSYTHDDFIKTSGLGCMTLLVKEIGTWWVSLKCEDKQHVLCEMDSDCKYEGDSGVKPPPVADAGAGGLDDDLIHLEGSLSRSICKQMKAFKDTKKLQPELKDKYEHAGGDDDCNWYQWEKCVSGENCAKFNPFACNKEGLVGDSLVHIDSSLSKSICKQMKDFQQTKKLQSELKDKMEFAAGDKDCSWFHWQKCQDGENCAKFDPKNCNEVPEPS